MTRGARVVRGAGVWLVAGLCAGVASAQQKPLTIDDLYDPIRKAELDGEKRAGYTWISDREYVTATDGRSGARVRVDALTGARTPLLEVAQLERALSRLPGMPLDEAARAARDAAEAEDAVFDAGYTAVVVTIDDDLYHWRIGEDQARRLTASPGVEEEVSFSPDGQLIAFVRDFNLFAVAPGAPERQLTTDGHDQLLNGKLDWVYQEEIYGRGNYRGYWWSPDSSHLAFLQLNEAPVPEFAVVDQIPYRQDLEITDYPKAGDPNPTVRLAVAEATGGALTWMDTSRYSAAGHLIVDVNWKPDSQQVAFQVQDREQTWLDLNVGQVTTGTVRTLFRETTPAWVAVNGSPVWLKDGSFLWLSERTGWNHLYHYDDDGTLRRQVTSGEWEVHSLYGIDESAGWAYFSGTERSHIGSDIYRTTLDGRSFSRLSDRAGTHAASFSPSFARYVDTWSDISTPPQVRLHAADGREIRVVDQGEVRALAEYRLSVPEFLQVPNRNGFQMEAMLIKPPGFDPARKYPVLQHTYAGPHAPQVRNRWGGTDHLYLQLLAQHGIVVWVCDNQSASGKGVQSAWVAYKRLGETELSDIEDGLDWLTRQPWVDATRIGISGWSYGGFMTSYALTHSTRFIMGIAGGSVTDWRNYDSIYTERLMLTPQNNPDGYRRTAPRWAAGQLHGKLLLIHGTQDDNVHVQNTLQFAYELQKAGKPFELMLYPKSRHALTDRLLVTHMRTRMLAFTISTLRPERDASAGTG